MYELCRGVLAGPPTAFVVEVVPSWARWDAESVASLGRLHLLYLLEFLTLLVVVEEVVRAHLHQDLAPVRGKPAVYG